MRTATVQALSKAGVWGANGNNFKQARDDDDVQGWMYAFVVEGMPFCPGTLQQILCLAAAKFGAS